MVERIRNSSAQFFEHLVETLGARVHKKTVQFVRFFSEILHCILDLYEHFQLPGHTVFLQDTYVTLIRPILGHPLSVKITGFIPLRQKHL